MCVILQLCPYVCGQVDVVNGPRVDIHGVKA